MINLILEKPALDIIALNSLSWGNLWTDLGKYLHAFLFPETAPPISGNIFSEYKLYKNETILLFGSVNSKITTFHYF